MRRAAVHDDLGARESLVADADRQVRRLGDHGFVGAPPRRKRVGAEAGILLVGDCGDDHATRAAPIASRASSTAACSMAARPPFMS